MPIREVYFNPTLVLRTDTETGKKEIEIEFTNSVDRDTVAWEIEPAECEKDTEWLDDVVAGNGYFEKCGPDTIRLHSLEFVS